MQIQNPNDRDAIEKSVEAADENVLREVPGPTSGQAVDSGVAMNTPASIQVRERRISHGAGSRPVIEERRDASEQHRREPTRSEATGFGEGDSTGVQRLD